MKRILFSLLLPLLFWAPSGLAAETINSEPTAAVLLPGIAEVMPRLAQLAEERTALETTLSVLASPDPFQAPLKELRNRNDELRQLSARLGKPDEWNVDRLIQVRALLENQKITAARLLAEVSARLEELDVLHRTWLEQQTFWQSWQESVAPGQRQITLEGFNEARRLFRQVEEQFLVASQPLMDLQGEVTTLQNAISGQIGQIEEALAALRGQVFQKTAPSFTNSEFYRQFNRQLWTSVPKGLKRLGELDAFFWHTQGWLAILQLLVAMLVAGVLLFQKRQAADVPAWQFLLRHPVAAGIFVSIVALGSFYRTPPPLWRLLLGALAAISAVVLVSELLRHRRKSLLVFLLAAVYIVSLALKAIALPEPLYRLYLTLLCVLGIPGLLWLASRERRQAGKPSDGFILLLKLGALLLGISLFAQFGGFVTLSARLLESTLASVFIGLFTAMTLRLGVGGMALGLRYGLFRQRQFFRRHGAELMARLEWLLKAFILTYAGLHLLVAWHLYSSVGEAWHSLLNFSVAWGSGQLSLKMVLWFAMVIYAAVVCSWFLRTMLDEEFFPHRKLDRGVSDSVKKLLHYSVVLLGFFLALSMAGIDLKNFAVLAGALGIGIGFGLQNIVNNFISGLILLFERPIKVGDIVVLDNDWGTVRKIGLRSTTVETFDLAELIVPNAILVSEKVTNWTLSNSRSRLVIPIGVAYGSDVPKVLAILAEAAREQPDVLEQPEPSPIFVAFGDSSLDFELRVWMADAQKRLLVRNDLLQYIDRRFREEGVEIPFPQRDLHLRSIDSSIIGGLQEKAAPPRTE